MLLPHPPFHPETPLESPPSTGYFRLSGGLAKGGEEPFVPQEGVDSKDRAVSELMPCSCDSLSLPAEKDPNTPTWDHSSFGGSATLHP